jgi:hypothetical protein
MQLEVWAAQPGQARFKLEIMDTELTKSRVEAAAAAGPGPELRTAPASRPGQISGSESRVTVPGAGLSLPGPLGILLDPRLHDSELTP